MLLESILKRALYSALRPMQSSPARSRREVWRCNKCTTFTCQATVRQNETAHSDVIEPFGLHVCWSHSRVASALTFRDFVPRLELL